MQAHPTTHTPAPSPYATAPPPRALAQVCMGEAHTSVLVIDLSILGINGCVRRTPDHLGYAIDVVTMITKKNANEGNEVLRRLKEEDFPQVGDFLMMKRCIFYKARCFTMMKRCIFCKARCFTMMKHCIFYNGSRF
jgi:hypothetical protein